VTQRAEALLAAARAWRDPDHALRKQAADRAVADGLTTQEAAAFACNQFAHACTAGALAPWDRAGGPWLACVAVRQRSRVPLLGVRAFAAAWVAARHLFLDASDPLLRAFADDAAGRVEASVLLGREPDQIDAQLLIGEDEGKDGVPTWRRSHASPHVVIDGDETDEEWIGLAEDLLLHDGESPRSPRIVWAPEALAPDDLLDALAGFRELFPAKPSLDGSLKMPRAFLEAAGAPHAWAPGFLLSKGDPEPQGPGHIRWATYGSLAEVRQVAGEAGLIASPRLGLAGGAAVLPPGETHRPGLTGIDASKSAAAFLTGRA
jgi:hypothetical protein